MVLSGYRRRVLRILAGDYRPDDVMALLLFLREKHDGRQVLRDIGDLVAHRTERTRGLIHGEVWDNLVIARFHLEVLNGGDRVIDFGNLPDYFPDYLRATRRRLTRKEIEKNGLKVKVADRILSDVIKALKVLPNGRLSLGRLPTAQENPVLHSLTSVLAATTETTNELLVSQMASALRSQGLLKKGEEEVFRKASNFIGSFTVATMHRSEVLFADGGRVTLYADLDNERLNVLCELKAKEFNGVPAILMVVFRGPPKASVLAETPDEYLTLYHSDLEFDSAGQLTLVPIS